MNLEQAKTPKKPYQKPNLRVYGDVKAVTATALTTHPHGDGGHGKFSKTS